MEATKPRNNTATWIVVYLTILGATTFLGLLVGYAYFQLTPTKYRSDASFGLTAHPLMPNNPLDVPLQHDQLISGPKFIESVLVSNKLHQLKCFENQTTEQAVKNIIANLGVIQNQAEPTIYQITLYSRRPDDSQTLINNLLADYGQGLKQFKVPPTSPGSEPLPPKGESEPDSESADLARLAFAERLRESGQLPAFKFQVLKPATYGEQVWPLLPIILAVTGGIGLLLGIAIVIVIFLKSRAMSREPLAS